MNGLSVKACLSKSLTKEPNREGPHVQADYKAVLSAEASRPACIAMSEANSEDEKKQGDASEAEYEVESSEEALPELPAPEPLRDAAPELPAPEPLKDA